jgi:hypothetical protein
MPGTPLTAGAVQFSATERHAIATFVQTHMTAALHVVCRQLSYTPWLWPLCMHCGCTAADSLVLLLFMLQV